MSGHAPGPWYTCNGDHDSKWVSSADNDICEVVGDNKVANARLIAAAPDLLVACECALSTGALEHGGVADILRAAISKAEGRNND